MPCDPVKLPGGGFAIACSRGRRGKPKPCASCGRPSALLCDGPKGAGKTCDKPICHACAWSPDPDYDFCPECAPAAKDAKLEAEFGAKDVL